LRFGGEQRLAPSPNESSNEANFSNEKGSNNVVKSVLEAIRMGIWDYEPREVQTDSHFDSTGALPGTDAKLDILAQRVSEGLPLWHPSDRRSIDDSPSPD